jgi:hypothetical protein
MTIEERYAAAHAEALTREHDFTLRYAEPTDATHDSYMMDSLAVALIATALEHLDVQPDAVIDWNTTIHGIIITMDCASTRLGRPALQWLASDPRIRWAEATGDIHEASLSIGLMLLKQYEAICSQ